MIENDRSETKWWSRWPNDCKWCVQQSLNVSVNIEKYLIHIFIIQTKQYNLYCINYKIDSILFDRQVFIDEKA